MTTTRCQVCDGRGDALLCRVCTNRLERTLGDLPALAHDLEAVATRQASGPLGLGDPRRQWDGPHAEGSLGDAPWEFAPGAADQLWAATNTIKAWVQHLVNGHGLNPPAATRGRWTTQQRWRIEIHRNRPRWRELRIWTPSPEQPLGPVVGWLLGQLGRLRYDQDAGQAFDELTGLHADMTAAVLGARPAEAFYGLCDKPDVVVEVEGDLLRPVVGKCGAQLFGTEDATRIDCPACGASYSREERDRAMIADLVDTLGTVRQVASTLTKLGRPVTIGQIDGWLRRGVVPPRGADPNGHRMVRVGDVLEQRDKPRRKATRSGSRAA